MGHRVSRCVGAGIAVALTMVAPLSASMFGVNPIQISLTAARPTGVLELKNDDPRALRFQIEAFVWSQGPAGEVELTPTTDIVVFPALLTVEAGEARRLRVAYTGAAGAIERTYRILVQELPPAAHPDDAPIGLMMLTHFSIPIFVQATAPVVRGSLDDASLRDGRVSFVLGNIGNTHFMTKTVTLTGRGGRGEVVLERSLNGWYMLAGTTRRYVTELSPEECRRLATLTATVAFGTATMTEPVAMPPGACPAAAAP